MLRYIRKGLRASGARAGTMAYKMGALATSFCVALGWTVGFLEIIGCVPTPWSASYATAVRSRLLEAWGRGDAIFNVHVRQC
eukprot:2218155-Pyramimonas_sp.AAC.1